ncbi:DUF3300 domain-containing protein [Tunturiibacter lichenicola]|uniref:DUF3300 domain-containing protein n=1 Tax=Tunturiibacter lichenicola TaxID=2051959 RepID=UPI003D9BE4A0
MCLRRIMVVVLAALMACQWVSGSAGHAQAVPTGDQLNQLVAPIALYPDTLLAQICAASTDPQQIIDTNNWVKQNAGLQGQALTNAAQSAGFDPAFISLVTFPQVLDMMATHIDDYAALGAAFKANQQSVMSAIQTLRQQAYASGALDSNEYQTVSVQQDGGTKVVIVQPANPQVVYVPQYQPQQVYVAAPTGPSTGDVIAASLLSFGAGIAIGALINNNQPYGWGGWGWGWGGRGVVVHNNVWVVNNHYHSPYPPYRPRPPVYGRPVYARPPNNWNNRPGYRPPPPGYRPVGPNNPGYRPPPNNGSGRPPYPGNGGRPPGNGNGNVGTRPPGNGNGGGTRPPGNGNGGTRPPGNGNGGGTRPPGNGGGTPPGNGGGTRPPGNGGGTRPPGNGGGGRPPATTRPTTPTTRPAPTPRPSPTPRPATRPAPGGSFSGHPQGGAKPAQRPQQQTGARPGGFGGNNNGAAARQASNRGKASAGGGGRPGGKPR